MLKAISDRSFGILPKATLLSPDLVLGDEILEMLDAAKFPTTAALWVLSEEGLGGVAICRGHTPSMRSY